MMNKRMLKHKYFWILFWTSRIKISKGNFAAFSGINQIKLEIHEANHIHHTLKFYKLRGLMNTSLLMIIPSLIKNVFFKYEVNWWHAWVEIWVWAISQPTEPVSNNWQLSLDSVINFIWWHISTINLYH